MQISLIISYHYIYSETTKKIALLAVDKLTCTVYYIIDRQVHYP